VHFTTSLGSSGAVTAQQLYTPYGSGARQRHPRRLPSRQEHPPVGRRDKTTSSASSSLGAPIPVKSSRWNLGMKYLPPMYESGLQVASCWPIVVSRTATRDSRLATFFTFAVFRATRIRGFLVGEVLFVTSAIEGCALNCRPVIRTQRRKASSYVYCFYRPRLLAYRLYRSVH
jgi:hypothetical protein